MSEGAPSPDKPMSTIPAEARAYQGHRAGVVSRVTANLLDVVVIVVVLAVCYAGWIGFRFLRDPRGFTFPPLPPLGLLVLLGLWLQMIYFAFTWVTTGRTYGGHVMGLRVVNFRGEKLRIWGAVVRAAFCVVLPVGLLWVVVSRENRSIQDVVLRSSVIYDWTARAPRAGRGSSQPPDFDTVATN